MDMLEHISEPLYEEGMDGVSEGVKVASDRSNVKQVT